MTRPDLYIIVCIDDRKCMHLESRGRNAAALLEGLKSVVKDHGLGEKVQVTRCYCIFGCTYGPRVDVIRRWSGGKALYGTTEGEVTISCRGRVKMSEVPQELLELVQDNLSESCLRTAVREECRSE